MGTEPTNEKQPQEPVINDDGIPAPSGETNLIDTDYVVARVVSSQPFMR